MDTKVVNNRFKFRQLMMVIFLLGGILAGGSMSQTLVPQASACSITSPTQTIEFVGVAKTRRRVSEIGENTTYRWTFKVRKSTKGSDRVTARKVGSVISLDVIERNLSATDQTNCYDMGVIATFKTGRAYKVAAAKWPDSARWSVNNYTGGLSKV